MMSRFIAGSVAGPVDQLPTHPTPPAALRSARSRRPISPHRRPPSSRRRAWSSSPATAGSDRRRRPEFGPAPHRVCGGRSPLCRQGERTGDPRLRALDRQGEPFLGADRNEVADEVVRVSVLTTTSACMRSYTVVANVEPTKKSPSVMAWLAATGTFQIVLSGPLNGPAEAMYLSSLSLIEIRRAR